MEPKDLPWPKAGDVLFQPAEDWWNNACLNYTSNTWDLYATGYKEAADNLAKSVDETRHHADLFVYPIVFLYRHYLELRLKDLLMMGQELTARPQDLKHIHRIDILWSMCRPILEEVWPNSEREALDAVEDCIKQFVKVDPASMSFRYPATKDGKPTLPDIKHINLRNLKDVLARTSALLEGASMGISSHLDNKREMTTAFL